MNENLEECKALLQSFFKQIRLKEYQVIDYVKVPDFEIIFWANHLPWVNDISSICGMIHNLGTKRTDK